MISFFQKIKYQIARIFERNPYLNLFIYNNISFLSFLLPHEKDYNAIKYLLKSHRTNIFLDVGANNGISTRGFRKLGFKNLIYLFEPNNFLYNKYLLKLNLKNIKIFNFGLGSKNCLKNIFIPFLGNSCLHYFLSSNKKYIINSIKLTSPNYLKKIKIIKTKILIKKYDDLNIKKKIDFIKIDVEGLDHFVLSGMKKSIMKNLPIILVEFNKENINKIFNILQNYSAYVFNFKNKKFINVDKTSIYRQKNKSIDIARSKKSNLLSIRNIFFIPKNKLRRYNHLFN